MPDLSIARQQLRVPQQPADGDATVANMKTKKKRVVPVDAAPEPDFADSLAREDMDAWGVDPRLRDCIVGATVGIDRFFPLQRAALEAMLQSPTRDACISARTGSGKTLMYLLPLVQSLARRVVVRLRGLVVVPSRDLAEQVFHVLAPLAACVGLTTCVAAGMRSVREEADELVRYVVDANGERRPESRADILVATPGRLVDHVERGSLDLQHLQTLVVDEADRLLSQAYQDWLERVYAAAHVPPPREASGSLVEISPERARVVAVTLRRRPLGEEQQGLSVLDGAGLAPRLRRILCSATLTRNPQKLAALALERPIVVSEPESAPALPRSLQEQVFWVSRTGKPAALLFLVRERLEGRVLVFCSSVARAARVHGLLEACLPAGSTALLSSQQTIRERARVLDAFRHGSVRALVASDVAARGLDVDNLECVVSYDCPHKARTYVHRAGRTARAARSGLSVVLCRKDQARHLREIKAKLGAAPPRFAKLDADDLARHAEDVRKFTDASSSAE